MSRIEEDLKEYYAHEITDRAGRELGDERTAQIAESSTTCGQLERKPSLRSAVARA